MLIEAPCRLGEKFKHTRPWGYAGPLYFVGLSLFVWGCDMDGVTLNGSMVPYCDNRTSSYHRSDLEEYPISFTVPDRLIDNDHTVPLREFGIEAEGAGELRSLHLKKDGTWFFRVTKGRGREAFEGRTEVLDKLFEPILPAVKLSAADFL